MNYDQQPSGRVAQALGIHRSIAACHAYLARNNDVHALTAALMLPCYRAEFGRLALAMSSAEKTALMSLLPADGEPPAVSLPRA
ncbi:hypothetical protein VAPA_1c46060 [Variovorax paradoxus B4]|uniref:Uncharacterized protein n=2 Tax=Variovorax paradoxus TaxID=34073 RepID=A0A0H2M265_VARPD|nr:hypothetical protein [Variovorax paradoxus]AGU51674.1 hypothetical protein VAPA_1c46060 [Variovorax paradoxus B4]KLN54837.1 hypothetical protein VPARA_41420 [Variovorax paradoxus]